MDPLPLIAVYASCIIIMSSMASTSLISAIFSGRFNDHLSFSLSRWIHDYQDACIDKLERFLKGEENMDKYIDNEIMAVRQMMAGHGLRTSSGGSSVS